MRTDIANQCGQDKTGQAETHLKVRVNTPVEAAEYPATYPLLMGLLEAGFQLRRVGATIHALHDCSGSAA